MSHEAAQSQTGSQSPWLVANSWSLGSLPFTFRLFERTARWPRCHGIRTALEVLCASSNCC